MCTRFRRAFVRRLQSQLQTGYIIKYPNCKVSIFFVTFRAFRFFLFVGSVFFVSVPSEQLKKTRVPFFSFSLSPFPCFANLRTSKTFAPLKKAAAAYPIFKILCNL